MKLVHTLLLLFRKDKIEDDKQLATQCLKSLEKGSYTTVVVYNQGYLSEDEVKAFLKQFNLNCIVIGNSLNIGTAAGRQACFEYIWSNMPNIEYISELHLDMILTYNWEDPLVDYLYNNDEPLVSCGIVDEQGKFPFINEVAKKREDYSSFDDYLKSLRNDKIVNGFTNPCVHVSKILKEAGGYNTAFLTGKQCFEDDSMLLGYYYYYGTRANWHPKVNYNSVVYHMVAGQRLGMGDSIIPNYNGLIKQYGVTGLKHLSELHASLWHKNFFSKQYENMLSAK